MAKCIIFFSLILWGPVLRAELISLPKLDYSIQYGKGFTPKWKISRVPEASVCEVNRELGESLSRVQQNISLSKISLRVLACEADAVKFDLIHQSGSEFPKGPESKTAWKRLANASRQAGLAPIPGRPLYYRLR